MNGGWNAKGKHLASEVNIYVEYLLLCAYCLLKKSFILAGFADMSRSSLNDVCINIERTRWGALLIVMDVVLVANSGRCLVVSS